MRHSPYIGGNVHKDPQVFGRRGAVSGLDMSKKPSPMPILSEDELIAMDENRLLVRSFEESGDTNYSLFCFSKSYWSWVYWANSRS